MYNQLILIFIIFIVILYCLNKYEHFSKSNNNTNKIVGNKNIFLNNYQLNPLENIKVNKICIKDRDSENIECLTKEQLFNAMELPIFRRHAICIDDACISKNDLFKINQTHEYNDDTILTNFKHHDDKCFNIDRISGAAGSRSQKKWEKDTHGKVKYNLLYRPKKGWKKKRSARQGKRWCNKHKYNSVEKYGCKAKPRYTKGSRVCWESSGGKCSRALRKKRRRTRQKKNKTRIITSLIPNIPVLKQQDKCDGDQGFEIKHGDLIKDFTYLNVPIRFDYQRGPNKEHETHDLIE